MVAVAPNRMHMGRKKPLWRGPQKAALLWERELAADGREVEALRYGIMDKPDLSVGPFRLEQLPKRMDARRTALVQETIRKRLETGVWRELSKREAAAAPFVSQEFLAEEQTMGS